MNRSLYLQSKPTYDHATGSTLETWGILFVLDRRFADIITDAGLSGLSQIGCLDAVQMMPAGGMSNTPMGSAIPQLLQRGCS